MSTGLFERVSFAPEIGALLARSNVEKLYSYFPVDMSTGKYANEIFNASWLGQAFFLSFSVFSRRQSVHGKILVG